MDVLPQSCGWGSLPWNRLLGNICVEDSHLRHAVGVIPLGFDHSGAFTWDHLPENFHIASGHFFAWDILLGLGTPLGE